MDNSDKIILDLCGGTGAWSKPYRDAGKFIEHAQGKLLDSKVKFTPDGKEVKYALYMIPKGEIFTEDAYYMLYDDPSTGKEYMSGVESCKTVGEGMAWKFDITPEEWWALKPLVSEA